LYPNPAKDIAYIKSSDDIEKIQLISYSGQIILDQITVGKQFEINTSKFEAGIYFVKIFSSNNVITRKLVIE
jgi:hypothetical protein